jgi:hypothetical protein
MREVEESASQFDEVVKAADVTTMPLFSTRLIARPSGGSSWGTVVPGDAYMTKDKSTQFATVRKELFRPRCDFVTRSTARNLLTKGGVRSDGILRDADIPGVQLGRSVPGSAHIGYQARLRLLGGNFGPLSLHLGAGVSSGFGIEDDSIALKAAGCGVKLGRKIEVSVFDNVFGIGARARASPLRVAAGPGAVQASTLAVEASRATFGRCAGRSRQICRVTNHVSPPSRPPFCVIPPVSSGTRADFGKFGGEDSVYPDVETCQQ